MVRASNINSISGNMLVDTGDDTYIVDGSSSNYTITLPEIKSDGIKYSFKRTDSTGNIITISGTNGQTIDSNTSIQLPPETNINLQSYNFKWYSLVTRGSEDIQLTLHNDGYEDITTTTYTGNMCRFVYKGRNYYGNDPINMKIIYSLSSGSTSSSFSAKLVNVSSTPNTDIAIITATATTSNTTYLIATTTTFTNIPNGASVFDLQAKLNMSSSPSIRIHSVYVKFS